MVGFNAFSGRWLGTDPNIYPWLGGRICGILAGDLETSAAPPH